MRDSIHLWNKFNEMKQEKAWSLTAPMLFPPFLRTGKFVFILTVLSDDTLFTRLPVYNAQLSS